jgi:hypothetical protein
VTSAIVNIALVVRLILELSLVVAASVWAWNASTGWMRLGGVVLAPAFVVSIWMLFLSPGAYIPLPLIPRLLIEAALFLGAAVGLASVALIPAGILLGVAWALDKTVLVILGNA